MSMFCNQCEQAANGVGCNISGVCGKKPDVAALQDLLLYALKGIAQYGTKARELGAKDAAVDRFIIDGLFTTVTNVDFDTNRLEKYVRQAATVRDQARALYEQAAQAKGAPAAAIAAGPATWVPAADITGLVSQGEDQ